MDQQNIKMENILHDNGNSCENGVDDDLEDGEILDKEYDTDLSQLAESCKRNTEIKASKKNCLEEGAKQKIVEAVNEEEILYVRGGTNNPDTSNFHDSKNKVDEDLEEGEILDDEYDTDLSQLAESSKRNTELNASNKNCLEEGAKQKKIEHSWEMDQRHQQSSHQQIIHAPLHNNFSGFNNNRSRNIIPLNKRVITKRDLSYQRDEDRGRKRLKVDRNDDDNKRTNEEERYNSCSKLDEEQERKILKNNLEKKPLLSMQTYDQPFVDDLSDDDEFHGLVIDEENFQNDVKDQLLPEKQKEPLNNKTKPEEHCLGEGAKQKKFEHSWDMDQRHQPSSHQQIIHAPLHNNFSGFNNNRSRNIIPLNKRVITKRDLSYQRDEDRGRKRLKVDHNDDDNKRTNEEERYNSCSKLDEEQERKILKNNLEKKPLLSMQTYDQPFVDDLSDDDEFHGLVIDEENFQNDVKDQLLPEKQKEPLNNKTKPEEFKEHCLGEGAKQKKLKYYMVPCEVSIRDYSDIPPMMGVDDPRLRKYTIRAAKDPLPIQGPLLQTPNPLQPSPVDIDMRQMLPPTMTYPQTMAILNDSHRKPTVPRDPRLRRQRFDVDQRLDDIHFFLN